MTLLKKTLTLALGEGTARALGVFTYVVIARALGVEGFGVFSFATSISLVALIAIDMGQNKHAGRLVSRSGGRLTHVFLRMTLNKLGIGLAVTVVAAAVMTAAGMSRESILTTVLLVGWATALNAVESLRAILRALDRMAADSMITSLESFGRFAVVLTAAWLGAGVVGFGLAFFIEALISATLAYAVVSRRVRLVPSAVEWAESRSFLRSSAAIGFVSIATIGFYRIDQMFVLPLAGETASGLYGAAARVAFTATVAASLVNAAAYPRLAAVFEKPTEYRRQLISTLWLSGIAGFLVAVTLFALAGPIIRLLYGEGYADSVGLLRILSIAIIFNAFVIVGLNSSNSLHREKRVFPVVAGLLGIVCVANLLLVPIHGALASAWISVGGEIVLSVLLMWTVRDKLFRGFARRLDEERVS